MTIVAVQMQGLVCVMVVIGLLTMRDHMIYQPSTLRQLRGPEYCQRLPQKYSQNERYEGDTNHCN
jgi:hypothetical protein